METNVTTGINIIPHENPPTEIHPTPAEIHGQFFRGRLMALKTGTIVGHTVRDRQKHHSGTTPIITLLRILRMRGVRIMTGMWTENGMNFESMEAERGVMNIGTENGIVIEITMRSQGINIPTLRALPLTRPLPPVLQDRHRYTTTCTTTVNRQAEVTAIGHTVRRRHRRKTGNIKDWKVLDPFLRVNLHIREGTILTEITPAHTLRHLIAFQSHHATHLVVKSQTAHLGKIGESRVM